MAAASKKHRILVTGAGGFVGGHLLRTLGSGDFAARCETFGLSFKDGQGADILDGEAVEAVIRETRPTAVVHLAAVAAPVDAKRSPRHAWNVNLIGTMNLAEALMRQAPEARFIHVGSSEAYGASFISANGPVDEDTLLRPMAVYAATKAASDLMIGQMSRDGLKALRFRPFNHTGPGQTTAYVVPAFASQVAKIMTGSQDPVIRVGNLEAKRDFVDVRDVVRAYAIAATAEVLPQKGEAIYNLASGQPWRIGEILDHLIGLAKMRIDIDVDPQRLRPNDVPVAAGNASRAATDLGWRAEIPMSETLGDVLRDQLDRENDVRTLPAH